MRRDLHAARIIAFRLHARPGAIVAVVHRGAMRIAVRDGDEEGPLVRRADEARRGDGEFAHVADAAPLGHQFRLIGKGAVRPDMLLADERGGIAGAAQHRGQRFDPRQQRLMMHVVLQAVHAVLMRVEPGVDHRAARAARGNGGIAVAEERAAAREAIKPRRLHRNAIAAKIKALIVGDQQEDIALLLPRRGDGLSKGRGGAGGGDAGHALQDVTSIHDRNDSGTGGAREERNAETGMRERLGLNERHPGIGAGSCLLRVGEEAGPGAEPGVTKVQSRSVVFDQNSTAALKRNERPRIGRARIAPVPWPPMIRGLPSVRPISSVRLLPVTCRRIRSLSSTETPASS